jgi:serine protease Do
MKKLLLVVLLACLPGCATTSIDDQLNSTVALINPMDGITSCAGVVIAKDRVLTARHCVNPVADNVPMKFRDGREAMGTVLVRGGIDVALVQVDTGNAPIARIAKSARVGDVACAVGHPFREFEWTRSCGVVSALRPVTPSFKDYGDHDWIQIDSTIHGGNSGGPVFNADGEVVGIVSWGLKNGNAGIEVNFIVPVLVALTTVAL